MKLELQVTFRDMEPSRGIEQAVREKAAKLDQFYDRITSCRVVVAAPHRHHHKGRLYNVRIDLTVPGGELVVNRDNSQAGAHHDVHVAIRDAFDAARRRVQDFARRRRGEVKSHVPEPAARVSKLFSGKGYGFIETSDGREIYFHENSVLEGFERLTLGTRVHFTEEEGQQGPQASTVRLAHGSAS